ncbi:hypothetical protein [Enterococcus phoeniculicola]
MHHRSKASVIYSTKQALFKLTGNTKDYLPMLTDFRCYSNFGNK